MIANYILFSILAVCGLIAAAAVAIAVIDYWREK